MLKRNWRVLLYLSPVVLFVATLAVILGFDALGASCRGAWDDTSYACNGLGDAQASLGVILGALTLVSLPTVAVAVFVDALVGALRRNSAGGAHPWDIEASPKDTTTR